MISVPRFCLLSLLTLGLGACASSKYRDATLRKKGYDRIVKSIRPGMTRQQLYALLPPARRPTASPPLTNSPASQGCTQREDTHPLDDVCLLLVRYQLKNPAEYPPPPKSRPHTGKEEPASLEQLMDTPEGYSRTWVPSRENPGDIVTAISLTQLGLQSFRAIDYEFVTTPGKTKSFPRRP